MITPIWEVQDDNGRPVRTFGLEKPWNLFFADLDSLKARVEEFEAAHTAELLETSKESLKENANKEQASSTQEEVSEGQ